MSCEGENLDSNRSMVGIALESVLTCPSCGHGEHETMPFVLARALPNSQAKPAAARRFTGRFPEYPSDRPVFPIASNRRRR